MKRMIGLMFVAICIYAIYFDLSIGTLPKAEKKDMDLGIEYVVVTVQPGDTVLSIIEELGGFPIGVSIEKMIEDFVDLNGIFPEQIQPGKSYKIPVYHKEDF